MNRNSKNLATSIIVQIVTIVVGLLLPRLILAKYGSVLNGLLSSTTQIIAYLSLVEMGLYSASIVALYKPIATNQKNEQAAVFAAVSTYYKKIAIYFGLGTVVVTIIYPFIIKDEIDILTICGMVLSVGMVNILTYLCLGKYKAFLQANNQLYIVNIVHSVGHSLYCILSVLVIFLNYNIVITRIALIVSLFVEYLLLSYYCKKNYSYLTIKVRPKPEAIQQRKDIMIHQVSALVLNSTDVTLLTIMGGSLSVVSVYSMYNMVANIALGLSNSIMSSVTASFGQKLAIGKNDELKKKVYSFEFWYDIGIFTIHVCMAILIAPFIRIYTNGVSDINYDHWEIGILFAISGILKVLRLPYSEMIHAKGHYKQTNPQQIISTSINLLLTLILIPKFGVAGALVGTIVSEFASSVMLRIYCYKHILVYHWKMSVLRLVFNYAVGMIMVCFCFMSTIQTFYPTDYYQFFCRFIVIAIIVACSFIIINLTLNYICYKVGRNYVKIPGHLFHDKK